MKQTPIVAMSPHLHSGDSVEKKMYRVLLALLPAFGVSLFVFGWGTLITTLVAVTACVLFEYLIQRFVLKLPTTVTDGSAALTGLLLAFNLPSNLPIWIIVIGALFAIGLVKQTFGGLGNNPFNPAIAARVFLLVSFPAQMTTWPQPMQRSYLDALTGATPLEALKYHGHDLPNLNDLLLGTTGGSLGEIGALALLLGGAYLLLRKVITWHVPVSILGTVFLFTFLLGWLNPTSYHAVVSTNAVTNGLTFAVFHLLSGGLLLGALFMATDYVTSPMTTKGQLIYGVGIGAITVIIRIFGSYPEGVSFAILIMNALTPLINHYVKPTRFSPGRS
ncbi:MAG: RnfABCDGE type electron transport complex subunit D [Bacteroidales bacterium]|nr:RnfABCDGE type electron transport complex subunit D [Bacteroidales bacterium]